MENYRVFFDATAAEKLTRENEKRGNEATDKIHKQIVMQIRKSCERRKYNTTAKVPVYMFGHPNYNPEKVLSLVAKRLAEDGYAVYINLHTREMRISWKTSSGKPVHPRKTRFTPYNDNLYIHSRDT